MHSCKGFYINNSKTHARAYGRTAADRPELWKAFSGRCFFLYIYRSSSSQSWWLLHTCTHWHLVHQRVHTCTNKCEVTLRSYFAICWDKMGRKGERWFCWDERMSLWSWNSLFIHSPLLRFYDLTLCLLAVMHFLLCLLHPGHTAFSGYVAISRKFNKKVLFHHCDVWC